MSYFLGIDLGTTYTAAAVCRDGKPEICRLGSRTPSIPSLVLRRDDGTVLTGEAAERRAVTEPQRVGREFKRRFGDPTPIILGGTPHSADALTAELLRAVVAQVTEVEGRPPEGIVVAHPANWGDYKQDLLTQAVRRADLGEVSFISEPEAAAIHYAAQERIPRGSRVAVYDLGGGTFDAAVLRRTEFGWQILGRPEGVEHLGGVDFDEAVFTHVADSIGDDFDLLDPDDPAVLSAVARLRHECVEAKEALAADTDVAIPVLLPSASTRTEVRLTRSELEEMIRPAIADSIAALERALRAARVAPGDVTSVLLVGGSSRIPLVAEMVGSALGRPVAVDAHPKHGVALGASLVADERGALAALTAAGEAATAAAASVAALASVRGATGDDTAFAGSSAGTIAAQPGTGSGSSGGARGSGGGTIAAPPGAGPVPAGERATPWDQPSLTPESGAGYSGLPTGPYDGPRGPAGPPRRPSSGSHRVALRRRSQVRAAIVLGSVFLMIVAAAATLFAYQGGGGDDRLFDPPPTTAAPPGQATTSTAPRTGDDRAGSPRERPPTTPSPSTTAATTTTAPSRTTTSAPPSTTAPTTTAPPTTAPPTTEPPTTEPPTTAPPTTGSP
jgi:actin-like ATPase involved in cell morphogenesis